MPDPATIRTSSAWASWLGVVAVVLGVLLAASHGTEWMRQVVIAQATPASGQLPAAECPADELIEEGLSLEECEQLVSEVRSFLASAPEWFPGVMSVLAAAGTLLAFLSVIVGAALLSRRAGSANAAIGVFGALAVVDLGLFIAAVNAGPILRGEYLWPAVTWFAIHLLMVAAAVAGRASLVERVTAPAGIAAGGPAASASEASGSSASGSAPAVAAAVVEARGYPSSAVVIHWLLAVSVFFLFASSWWMLALPLPSEDFRYREFPFQLHKNIGLTLVVLLGILLYVRWRRRPAPVEGTTMRPWMKRLASVDHILLYVLIIAVCVSGYMSSSYSGWGTRLWWLVDLPNWGYEHEELNIFYSDIHLWTCWALLAVVAVHIGGAVYHAFRNDGVVRRMLRF